jgi:RNA polymerase sigma-70 factor (ECF subfamily)
MDTKAIMTQTPTPTPPIMQRYSTGSNIRSPPKAPRAKKRATGPQRFKTTPWSLVKRAIVTGEPTAETRNALRELLDIYRPALIYWIEMHRKLAVGEAEDLVHGFVLRVIERNLLAKADPVRGRLRNLLCRSLWNHAATQGQRTCREVPLELEDDRSVLPSGDPAADRSFDRAWARLLVARAKAKVFEAHYPKKATLFAELIRWIDSDADGETAAAVGARLGKTANAVTQAACVLRGHLREQIRAEVAETLMRPQDVDDELKLLLAALEDET